MFGSKGTCISKRFQEQEADRHIDNFEGLGIFLDTYANARHGYAFPRITAMQGDGTKSYNYSKDGQDEALAACSANFRRTNVGTKLKLTYVKEGFLELKIQYKACESPFASFIL